MSEGTKLGDPNLPTREQLREAAYLRMQEIERDVKSKIRDIETLPTHEEVLRYFNAMEDFHAVGGYDWSAACQHLIDHVVFNVEFINSLAEEIRALASSPIIEICAGRGKLTHQLRKLGIEISASDDLSDRYSSSGAERERVEFLPHDKVIEKYHPQVAVASWIPEPRIGHDILSSRFIRHFIDISPTFSGAWIGYPHEYINDIIKGDDPEMFGWSFRYLDNVERFSIGRTDTRLNCQEHHNTRARLFSRK